MSMFFKGSTPGNGAGALPARPAGETAIYSWCQRRPLSFMAAYMVFYLLAFFALEERSTGHMVWVHCRLDDLIPFCKYAIVPYIAWFVWIPFTLFYFLHRMPRAEFARLCVPLFAGMTAALVCYTLVPTALYLRPYRVYGSDIFARTVRLLYSIDTSTNVCPSIHVYNSVTLALAYCRSPHFMQNGRRWVRAAAVALCAAIMLSTVLLRQHSVIDVLLGTLLALVIDRMATARERRPLPALWRA